MHTCRILPALFFCLPLLSAGCGGGGLPPGETGTVSGVVTYNGDPVPENCTITFVHSGEGYIASGQTDAGGAYTLRMRSEPRVVVGSYRVSVTPPAAAPLSEEEIEQLTLGGGSPPPPVEFPFPEKFASPESSPLTYEVKAGENTINVEMKD